MRDEVREEVHNLEERIREINKKTRALKRNIYLLFWSNPDTNFFQKAWYTVEWWLNLRRHDIGMYWKMIKLKWVNR